MIIYKINPHKRFPFHPVTYHQILKQIKNLDTKKKYS